MANIGEPEHRIELEPFPDSEPVREPSRPVPAPVKQPEPECEPEPAS